MSSYLVQTIQILFISVLKWYSNTISIQNRSYDIEFMNGMVFTTIFAYFLTYIPISAYYNLNFGISHP